MGFSDWAGNIAKAALNPPPSAVKAAIGFLTKSGLTVAGGYSAYKIKEKGEKALFNFRVKGELNSLDPTNKSATLVTELNTQFEEMEKKVTADALTLITHEMSLEDLDGLSKKVQEQLKNLRANELLLTQTTIQTKRYDTQTAKNKEKLASDVIALREEIGNRHSVFLKRQENYIDLFTYLSETCETVKKMQVQSSKVTELAREIGNLKTQIKTNHDAGNPDVENVNALTNKLTELQQLINTFDENVKKYSTLKQTFLKKAGIDETVGESSKPVSSDENTSFPILANTLNNQLTGSLQTLISGPKDTINSHKLIQDTNQKLFASYQEKNSKLATIEKVKNEFYYNFDKYSQLLAEINSTLYTYNEALETLKKHPLETLQKLITDPVSVPLETEKLEDFIAKLEQTHSSDEESESRETCAILEQTINLNVTKQILTEIKTSMATLETESQFFLIGKLFCRNHHGDPTLKKHIDKLEHFQKDVNTKLKGLIKLEEEYHIQKSGTQHAAWYKTQKKQLEGFNKKLEESRKTLKFLQESVDNLNKNQTAIECKKKDEETAAAKAQAEKDAKEKAEKEAQAAQEKAKKQARADEAADLAAMERKLAIQQQALNLEAQHLSHLERKSKISAQFFAMQQQAALESATKFSAVSFLDSKQQLALLANQNASLSLSNTGGLTISEIGAGAEASGAGAEASGAGDKGHVIRTGNSACLSLVAAEPMTISYNNRVVDIAPIGIGLAGVMLLVSSFFKDTKNDTN